MQKPYILKSNMHLIAIETFELLTLDLKVSEGETWQFDGDKKTRFDLILTYKDGRQIQHERLYFNEQEFKEVNHQLSITL